MADETTPPADDAVPAAPKAKRSYATALVIAAGLLGGGGFGMFVSGPLLANRVAKPAGAASTSPSEAHEGTPRAAGGEPVMIIDNLVLNPAESAGLRFLLVTVGLRLADGAGSETMKARDAEIRDVIMRVLGSKRVDELANIGLREKLKKEVASAIDALVGKASVSDVYFPQFVIQ